MTEYKNDIQNFGYFLFFFLLESEKKPDVVCGQILVIICIPNYLLPTYILHSYFANQYVSLLK